MPVLVFAGISAICTQLWRTRISAPSFVAQVDHNTAQVRAPLAGAFQPSPGLAELQSVSTGETLGWIEPASPEIAAAEIAILRRELDALHSSSEAVSDVRRIELEQFRLQLEWMQARVSLADLQAQHRAARDTVRRFDQLLPSGAVPEQDRELAIAALDGLGEAVAAQTEAITLLTPSFDSLDTNESGTATPLRDALAVQEARLLAVELQLAPQPLIAPMDGVVLDHSVSGEHLLNGETAVTLIASSALRIIGYERQPLDLTLNAGDLVTVRSRRNASQSASAVLLEVSPSLEPVPTQVLALWRSTLPEIGRRYQFSLPSGLALLPGEFVEISVISP